MAVDKTGNDKPVLRVDALVIAVLNREGVCRSDPRDVTAAPSERRLRNAVDRVLSALVATGGKEADVGQYRHFGSRL